MDVEDVCLRSGVVRLKSGEQCRITTYLDYVGDETTDMREAIFAVAQSVSGEWIAAHVLDDERVMKLDS